MIHDFDVVEVNYRVDGSKSHVIEETRQDHVLKILNSEGLMYLSENIGVPDWHHLFEDDAVLEIFPVLQLRQHFRIIWYECGLAARFRFVHKIASRRTFQCSDASEVVLVIEHNFQQSRVVEKH